MSEKRKRKGNFSQTEMAVLSDLVKENEATIFASFSSTINNQMKKKIWAEICDKVNACSSTNRSVEEIKKKYQDYRSQVKKMLSEHNREARKTGGGPAPPPLSDIQIKVAATIPECQIVGFGGCETGIVGIETTECPQEDFVSVGAEGLHPIVPMTSEQTELDDQLECDDPMWDSQIGVPEPVASTSFTRTGQRDQKKMATKSNSDILIEMEREKMEEEREFRKIKFQLTERKIVALESIAKSLKSIDSKLSSTTEPFSLSPIIKF